MQPLQRALKDAFEPDEYLFGSPRIEGSEVKVAVTATSTAGSAVVLSNYNRTCEDKRTYLVHLGRLNVKWLISDQFHISFRGLKDQIPK